MPAVPPIPEAPQSGSLVKCTRKAKVRNIKGALGGGKDKADPSENDSPNEHAVGFNNTETSVNNVEASPNGKSEMPNTTMMKVGL